MGLYTYYDQRQDDLTAEELENIPLFMPSTGVLGVDLDAISVENEADLFLFPDEVNKERSADSKISSWTGTSYVIGSSVGVLWGLGEGLSASKGVPRRLFVNSMLNSVGRRASFLGNYGAVLALMLSLNETAIEKIAGKRENLNTFGAAILTGILFKATAGKRAMAIAGAVGGATFGVGLGFSRLLGTSRVIPF